MWQAGISPNHAAILLEACRAVDRLDQLDELLCGDVDVWARIVHNARTEDYELKIDAALTQANSTASQLRQLLAALPKELGQKAKAVSTLDELAARRRERRSASAGSDAAGVHE